MGDTLLGLLFLTKVTLLDPATPSCSGDYMVLCALEDQQLQQVQLLSWKSVKYCSKAAVLGCCHGLAHTSVFEGTTKAACQ